MALGSFLTPSRSLNLLFLSFLAGAVLSVFRLFLLHFRAGRTPPSAPGLALRSVHFSVPVFAAAVLMTGGDLLCASCHSYAPYRTPDAQGRLDKGK